MDGRATTIIRCDGARTEPVELRPDGLIPQPYLPLLIDRAEDLLDRPEEQPKTAMKAP